MVTVDLVLGPWLELELAFPNSLNFTPLRRKLGFARAVPNCWSLTATLRFDLAFCDKWPDNNNSN